MRTRQPLLVILIARRELLNIRDAPQLVLRFVFRLANNRISRNTELERWQIVFCPALAQVGDFLSDAFRRIAVHQIRVAFLGDQLFCRGRFAARVKRWPRLRYRFGLKNIVINTVVLPRK